MTIPIIQTDIVNVIGTDINVKDDNYDRDSNMMRLSRTILNICHR